MEGKSEKGPPPLQVDPKWYAVHFFLAKLLTTQRNSIQDALRAFLPPIKNDDTRLDFYAVYKKAATEYDVDYIKKYDEDLNTTLIFVCRLPLTLMVLFTRPLGWSVLRSQLSVCHRCTIKIRV